MPARTIPSIPVRAPKHETLQPDGWPPPKGYANGIKGSEAFMPEDMKTAPEIVVPPELVSKGKFSLACPAEVTAMYTKIWTDLQK